MKAILRKLKRPLFPRDVPPRAAIVVVALVMIASVVTGRERPAQVEAEPATRLDSKVQVSENLDIEKLQAREKTATPAGNDPFARRSFSAEPVFHEKNLIREKPKAPELPFRYVGKLIDEGQLSVFVTRGDDSYTLKAGETIGNEYRVDKVSESAVTFTFLPLKARQELQIPAVNQ